MCGIVGYWDKTGDPHGALGQILLKMLTPLGCRGPDSAGVALFGPPAGNSLIVRVKHDQAAEAGQRRKQLTDLAGHYGKVEDVSVAAAYLRLVLRDVADSKALVSALEALDPSIEVVSLGRSLEIIKQVGSPHHLDESYGVSRLQGSHGIGHTRLSTESKVDLSHSQPFWAHGYPDLAIVHNGHITNYHQLRRRYEQRGIRFYTENDSEIIGVYLAEQLCKGSTLEQALRRSLYDLDGSFSCMAATGDALGFVRDPFAFKPLAYTETETFAAVATEEIAIRSAFAGDYAACEAKAKDVRVWRR